MLVAVTYEDGEIFQHFGHTSSFKLYETEGKEIISECVIDTNGHGHGALATLLSEYDVEVLICGGIGGGAQMALSQAGIRLYGGVSGSADAAVKALLEENLNYNPNVKCNHHDEGHEHHGNCSGGGCGNHSCGQ
ncbi:MAG: NifB/NifX family molybdenum-iron cluster-binding protein [Lachnospiraceae bacterium]|nr:NifB/NifX family molybdenum-iron cluster-binding protein [Lachnospiraceae bacterium]